MVINSIISSDLRLWIVLLEIKAGYSSVIGDLFVSWIVLLVT